MDTWLDVFCELLNLSERGYVGIYQVCATDCDKILKNIYYTLNRTKGRGQGTTFSVARVKTGACVEKLNRVFQNHKEFLVVMYC